MGYLFGIHFENDDTVVPDIDFQKLYISDLNCFGEHK
jgi:hypothetical protein